MSRVIPYTPRNVRGRAVLNSRDTFWLPEWVVSRMHHVRGFKGRRIRTRRCIEWVRSRSVAQRRKRGARSPRNDYASSPDYSSEWSHLSSGSSTEWGRNRKGWKARTFVCLARERNRADPISSEGEGSRRSSARSSFHKHIYRRLDALQWRFNLANAFCALWPAGLSLFLSFYPLPILPCVRRWFARFFSFSVFLTEAGWWSELFPSRATRSRQSRSVSSQKTDFFFFWKWIVVPLNFFRCIFFSFFLFLLNVSSKDCLIK